MKKIIILLIGFLPAFLYAQSKKMLTFSFTLPAAARVSAGVYNGEVLVRTLFSNKNYDAGKHDESYEALDDEMKPITNANGLTVKVLSNNVKYEWEGVIGNTSDSMTGNSVYHNYGPISSMAFAGNFGYYAVGYNERKPSYGKFNITTPNQRIIITDKRIAASCVATDGNYVYWGCQDPYASYYSLVFATRCADDKEVVFSGGVSFTTKAISSNFPSVINLTQDSLGLISSVAVQRNGNFLFVSRKGLNRIDVLNKITGALIASHTLNSVSGLGVDGSDNLWAVVDNVVVCFAVSESSLSIKKTISGFKEANALAISPDNSTILVVDKGTSQIKAFTLNGVPIWTLGQEGGYRKDPTVYNDKFYMNTIFKTFISYQPDGTFWIGDPGNTRVQHFSSNRTFINNIAYRPQSYSTFVDKNNPTRIFSDYCEYKVDYSKPLAPDNGSWKLVKNWGNNVSAAYDNKFSRLRNVITLSNGRTYAFLKKTIFELPATGNLRMVNTIEGTYDLYENGDLRRCPNDVKVGKPMTWYKRQLTGFVDGDPVWANETPIATVRFQKTDPNSSLVRSQAEITSSNILLAYEGDDNRGVTYHLAGVKIGDTTFRFRVAKSTQREYQGDFPLDGSFDIGNGIVRTGDVKHHAVGRNIFYGQHGEFWKGSQVNQWNHYYDDGLLVGHFGVSGPDVANQQAPYGMAGNIFTGNAFEVGGTIYLTHNDEGHHGGVHVWKISNLSSIKEQTVPLRISDVRAKISDVPGNSNQLLLMKELPFNQSLVDGTAGWQRNPKNDDLTDKSNNFWKVQTNVKSHDPFGDPDIYVKFRRESPSEATLSKNLGTNNTNSWSLSGELNYANNYAATDGGSGGQFFDILDQNGKVIFRFFPQVNYDTRQMKLIANDVEIASGPQSFINNKLGHFQPFTIKVSNGKLSFQFAAFPEKLIPFADVSANYKSPATVRLYFWTKTKKADRIISIKDFKFSNK